MQKFASLLDTLAFTSSTLAKRRLMADYFRTRPDPERGLALAALTSSLNFAVAKPSLIHELITGKVDPVLFNLSRDYVGDMAETVALIWPTAHEGEAAPTLEEVVQTLSGSNRKILQQYLTQWLDTLDAAGRWALLKLITGNIRIGVSARLAKTALADAFEKDVEDIEQLWHSLTPPYTELFTWLEGGEKPEQHHRAYFMPMMLSHPIEDAELKTIDLNDFQAELKWDGIRIQLVRQHESVALYSRTGDDISHTFPDIVESALVVSEQEFVLDGELLTTTSAGIASFNSLQQRLNRKKVSAVMLTDFPAHVRLYDILIDNGEDIRALPLSQRRARLEGWIARLHPKNMDLSAIIQNPTQEMLEQLRHNARHTPENGVEGLMLKRLSSPYIAGRPRGHWFKWKRGTLTLDCVMLYAQRGSGKRSSYYSDYTFGVWHESTLVPIGKAYSGFTDQELLKLDKWIRAHTKSRFGPVLEVTQKLVLEIEFDSIAPSKRHKSGLAMRFPRVHRIRWDKPAGEADTLETARAMVI